MAGISGPPSKNAVRYAWTTCFASIATSILNSLSVHHLSFHRGRADMLRIGEGVYQGQFAGGAQGHLLDLHLFIQAAFLGDHRHPGRGEVFPLLDPFSAVSRISTVLAPLDNA